MGYKTFQIHTYVVDVENYTVLLKFTQFIWCYKD